MFFFLNSLALAGSTRPITLLMSTNCSLITLIRAAWSSFDSSYSSVSPVPFPFFASTFVSSGCAFPSIDESFFGGFYSLSCSAFFSVTYFFNCSFKAVSAEGSFSAIWRAYSKSFPGRRQSSCAFLYSDFKWVDPIFKHSSLLSKDSWYFACLK